MNEGYTLKFMVKTLNGLPVGGQRKKMSQINLTVIPSAS